MQKRIVALAPVVLVATLALAFERWRYGRASFEDCWNRVQVGMSKAEVEALLGEPNSVYGPGNSLLLNWLFDDTLEKWAYGHRRSLTTQASFPYIGVPLDGLLNPEAQDHVVYFSKDGMVVKTVYPYRVPEQSPDDPRSGSTSESE